MSELYSRSYESQSWSYLIDQLECFGCLKDIAVLVIHKSKARIFDYICEIRAVRMRDSMALSILLHSANRRLERKEGKAIAQPKASLNAILWPQPQPCGYFQLRH